MADNDPVALLALADIHRSKGNHDKAKQALKEALALADTTSSGDVKLRLDIMMKLAQITNLTGEWVDSLMYLDNVFLFASEKKLSGTMCEALLASGSILSKKGKWDIAQKKFDQVMEILGKGSNRNNMARALVGKGTILWRKGMGNEAINLARKAFSMAEESDNHEVMGSAQALVSSVAFDMGDYQLSLKSNEKALHHFRNANDASEMVRVLNNTGETYKLMQNYSMAIDCFERGLEAAKGIGVRRNMAYLLVNLAECHTRQGRIPEARKHLSMANENAQGIQDDYLRSMLLFVQALISGKGGDTEGADNGYRAAIGKMESLGIPFDSGLMQMAYGEYLKNQGRSSDSVNMLNQAADSFSRAGSLPLLEAVRKELASFG